MIATITILSGQQNSQPIHVGLPGDAAISLSIQPPAGLVETITLQGSIRGTVFVPVQRPDGTDYQVPADKLTVVDRTGARYFLVSSGTAVAADRVFDLDLSRA